MASVTSYTAEKLQELLSGWSGIDLSQQEILALIGQLYIASQSADANVTEVRDSLIPQFQAALDANSNQVADLAGTTVPDIEESLVQAHMNILDINSVDIPGIKGDLQAQFENLDEIKMRPRTFSQDEPPEDEDDRELQVGDLWNDTNDAMKQYKWDGTAWTPYEIPATIADLSITVQKFKTSTHMIY